MDYSKEQVDDTSTGNDNYSEECDFAPVVPAQQEAGLSVIVIYWASAVHHSLSES